MNPNMIELRSGSQMHSESVKMSLKNTILVRVELDSIYYNLCRWLPQGHCWE
jgi:hypothetical protein